MFVLGGKWNNVDEVFNKSELFIGIAVAFWH